MSLFDKVGNANDVISRNVSVISSKKEQIGKTLINGVLLFIILLVFGCLDFATLKFHFEYLATASYWGAVTTKAVAGLCAFNIGINLMWDTEIKRDAVLEKAILKYEVLKLYKALDFEKFCVKIFNPEQKKQAYISKINKKINTLNKFSRARDRLLYNSELPENEKKKAKNHYCRRRTELENLKKEEYISKNIDSIIVHYLEVDATTFELEIDGSKSVKGIKTKGNTTIGRVKATSTVFFGIIGFSMFVSSFTLSLNAEQFASQMEAFWHYCLKCCEDIGIILWQTLRGMLTARKIISSELTQAYVGRNKVLMYYLAWKRQNATLTEEEYKAIMQKVRKVDGGDDDAEVIEITEEEYKRLSNKE